MGIENTINNDIRQAMLAKEKEKLEALRAMKAALLLEKTKKGGSQEEVPDEVALGLLQRMIKQRRESADIYLSQNRKDLADIELFQLSVIEAYLPVQLSEDAIIAELQGIIAETGATGIKDMGRVMGIATKKMAGRADNKTVAELVKRLLA
jgi:uncharacterized protein YqeY